MVTGFIVYRLGNNGGFCCPGPSGWEMRRESFQNNTKQNHRSKTQQLYSHEHHPITMRLILCLFEGNISCLFPMAPKALTPLKEINKG